MTKHLVIDAHTHINPEKIVYNRADFFTNEPEFQMIYDSPKARLSTGEDMIRRMDGEETDICVVFSFPWRTKETFQMANDYVLETVHRFKGRFIGLACFDPMHPDAAKEAERCLDSGLSGVGELAMYEKGIDREAIRRLAPVMELLRDRDLPVLMHTNEPVGHMYPGKAPMTLVEIYNFVKAFPENKIVLAHWGGGIFMYTLLKREVKEALSNVYYDTAASPFLYRPDIYSTGLGLAGREKVLFGTDYPLLKKDRYVKDMQEAGLSSSDMQMIMGENAQKVFPLPG